MTPASPTAGCPVVVLDTAKAMIPRLPLVTTWSMALQWLLVCLLLPHHPGNNPG